MDNQPYQERILLVDDAPINLQMLHQLLNGRGFALRTAKNSEDALRIAKKERPDLILLDIVMPGVDGFETCRLLKADPQTCQAAVIFMSSLNELDNKVQGFEAGAVDYITKPFEAPEVLARVHTHLTIQRLQRNLAEARDRAVAATRAKSRFLANMTHELRTPLNVIIGYSEMLMAEAGDRGDTALANDLESIRSAGKGLLALINDILDLSKVEADKLEIQLETFSLDELLKEIAGMAVPLVRTNANVFELKCSALGEVCLDRLRLKQILLNLLGNACKFTKNGTVAVTARREPEGIWIEVQDTGIGMNQVQQQRIFEEYSQAEDSTTKNYGGTGLGLAIARRLTDLMGGSISLESAPGVGSTFRLHFPEIHQGSI